MADQSSNASTDSSEFSFEPASQPKKSPMSKTVDPKPKAAHPTTSVMVIEAIEGLADRSGSSLRAIKKFISEKYSPITELQSTHIKKYLKKAVADGSLVQPKGKKGITASFKMPSAAALAAQRKMAKAVVTNNPGNSASDKKYYKTSSTKLTSPSKKHISTKTGPKALSADHKNKSGKATKTGPMNVMAKKITKPRTRKIPISKSKIHGPELISRSRVVY